MPYTVALIGTGHMGRVHARHWAAMPDAEIVGVLHRDRETARAFAQEWAPVRGPEAGFDDWHALLAHARPDLIDICTPTPTHAEFALRAAAAGKAVFVEKPLARTMADCDRVVEAVARAGTPLMAGHVVRYFPDFAAARCLILSGGVGAPAAARTARLASLPGRGRAANWYADPVQSGGVVLDLIVHDFDWLRWCFGPVTRVCARGLYGQAVHIGLRDYALATLRHASGVVSHVTGSWAHPGGFRTTLEVAGDTGLIEYDSARSVPLSLASVRSEDGGARGAVAVPESPVAAVDEPYFLELRAFLDALSAGSPVPVTAEDAREAVRIALAAIQSIETGKVVSLA